MLRKVILAVSLGICVAQPAGAVLVGSAESQKLVAEGHALQASGQYKEALEKFEAARKLSPDAASPLSSAALLLQNLASGMAADAGAKARQQADGLARAALKLAANDPMAAEVLRMQSDPTPVPAYKPTDAAAQAYAEGEVLFHQGQYEAARQKYRAAQRADPKFSNAWLMEGDTYFVEKNWPAAEMLFQRAAAIDPQNAQAWRFQADALMRLGSRAGAETAALNAVAAQPGQQPSWERLAMISELSKQPYTRLRLERKAFVSVDPKTGKSAVQMDAEFKGAKPEANTDYAMWLTYAIAQVNARAAAEKDGRKLSPYALELAGWSAALKVADELVQAGNPAPASPALQALRKLAAPEQLEAAVLLLMYREAYRPEFEAWKQAHPDGIRAFFTANHLIP